MLHRLFSVIAVITLLILPAPILVVIASSFTQKGNVSMSIGELSLRWYREFFASDVWLHTLLVSVLLAAAAALLTTVMSVLAALVLTRRQFAMSGAFRLLMLAPLIFPHAAIGVAMLGLVNSIAWRGTYLGVLLVHLILVIPFAFRPVLNSMAKIDPALEEAGLILGGTPRQNFWRIVFPLLRPGLSASLLFGFIMSFDEVTVTSFIVGPSFTTLPVQVFAHVQDSGSPVIAAVSTVLVVITLLVVVLLDRLVGLELFISPDRRR
jgi:putative spermidine/putrescine transport system permease protein